MRFVCTNDTEHNRFHAKVRVIETHELNAEGDSLDTIDIDSTEILSETGDPELVCAVCDAPARREG